MLFQGGYGTAPMSSPTVSDPYMPSYYPSMPFSYLNHGGIGEGAWSNGGDPTMSFLSGYGQVNNDYMSGNGMFSGFGYNTQPGFGWEFSGSDYSAWGNSTQGRKNDDRTYEAYYRPDNMGGPMDSYGAMNGELDRENGVKTMEQGFKGMNLVDGVNDPTGKEHNGQGEMPIANSGHPGGHQGQPMSQAPKKMSWASVASQPAKPQPQLKPKSIPRAPVLPSKHNNMDIGTWESKNNQGKNQGGGGGSGGGGQSRQSWSAPRGQRGGGQGGGQTYSPGSTPNGMNGAQVMSNSGNPNMGNASPPTPPSHPVLDRLRSANQYNPKDFNMNPKAVRFFIIKSYSEDDIHRSIKYSIWCSTEHGNKRLDAAYREREGKGPIYLFFSVNGSGHFCGMAQMMSAIDYSTKAGVWAQDKWKGQFEVKWIYVKDVPNSQLRHIRLENNENKPVTNSRDTQEVPPEKGKQVLKIMHNYRHTTSIFDDFGHYEKRQEEDQQEKPY